MFCNLERIAQGELDQTRHTARAHNLAEGAVWESDRLDIGHGRIRKIGMVPQVEHVSGEAERLALRQTKVLDQREVPVLLVRATVNIPAEIPESVDTEVRVRGALSLILRQDRYSRKVRRIQIAIETSVDVAARIAAIDGRASSEVRRQGGGASVQNKSRTGGGVENRERQPGLENGHAGDLPATEKNVGEAGRMAEER